MVRRVVEAELSTTVVESVVEVVTQLREVSDRKRKAQQAKDLICCCYRSVASPVDCYRIGRLDGPSSGAFVDGLARVCEAISSAPLHVKEGYQAENGN